jgi:hypothetical protein
MRVIATIYLVFAINACNRVSVNQQKMHSSIEQIIPAGNCYLSAAKFAIVDSCSLIKIQVPDGNFVKTRNLFFSKEILCHTLYLNKNTKGSVSIDVKKRNYYDSVISYELTWIAQSAISTSLKNGYSPLLIDSFRNENHVKVGVFCYKSVFKDSSTNIVGNYTFQTKDSVSTTVQISLKVKDEKEGFETVKCVLRSISFL